jgi:hypothetical protein
MYSPSMIIAVNHILDLQDEAAANRLAKLAKANGSGKRSAGRIAAAIANFRSLLSSPAEASIAMPKLSDYPYRS